MLLALLVPAPPASAQTTQVHAFAMTSHPFSDPVWFPVAHPQKMGCMWNNKGCPPPQIQKYWAWDIMAEREHKGQYHQKVYAMGAGIVHIQFRHQGCGGSHEARGNTLWINHGGGVVSTYLHLADHFLVHDGDYVSARTPIAYVGNSGYKLCHQKPYERFLAVTVQHNARVIHRNTIIGDNMQVKQTYACVNGQKVTWPQQLPGHTGHQGWNRWYNVPVGTPIPHTSGDRGCIPAPATANMPHDAQLKRGSSTGLAGDLGRRRAQLPGQPRAGDAAGVPPDDPTVAHQVAAQRSRCGNADVLLEAEPATPVPAQGVVLQPGRLEQGDTLAGARLPELGLMIASGLG